MRFLQDALITVVIIVGSLGLLVFAVTRRGLTANAEPARLETYAARGLRMLSIPAGVRAQVNPFASQPDAWRQGAAHFEDRCAICHDADGRGRSEIGRNLYPKPPDMTQGRTQELTDGELFSIIQNGVCWTGMPAWKAEHSSEETWRLVSFIRHLLQLTPTELQQIMPSGSEADQHEHGPHDHHDEKQ